MKICTSRLLAVYQRLADCIGPSQCQARMNTSKTDSLQGCGNMYKSNYHWIGPRENLKENPLFHEEIFGTCRCSLKSIWMAQTVRLWISASECSQSLHILRENMSSTLLHLLNHLTLFCFMFKENLVGGLEPWNFMAFHSVGNFIIPTDELICFRRVGQPPTRNQTKQCMNNAHWSPVWRMA